MRPAIEGCAMERDTFQDLSMQAGTVEDEYQQIPLDLKKRVEAAVAIVLQPNTEWQHKIFSTVAMFYLKEVGGEPKLCKDGSKIIQQPTRTYLNRAIKKAATYHDRTVGHIQQMCIYDRCDGGKAEFVEELMNIKLRLETRVD